MLLILRILVCAACLLALGVDAASAQPAGRLAGVVRDATGSALPGVTLTVAGPALTAPRTVVTDDHGEYVLDSLPEGHYLVTATFSGFEPRTTEVPVGTGRVKIVSCVEPRRPGPQSVVCASAPRSPRAQQATRQVTAGNAPEWSGKRLRCLRAQYWPCRVGHLRVFCLRLSAAPSRRNHRHGLELVSAGLPAAKPLSCAAQDCHPVIRQRSSLRERHDRLEGRLGRPFGSHGR